MSIFGSDVEWHGDKGYGRCDVCHKHVQINKRLFGGLHLCLTKCEQAGKHLEVKTRRRGPFWNRRTETYCKRDMIIITVTKKKERQEIRPTPTR